MLTVLNGFMNLILIVRIGESIVGKLIKAKVNYGLAHPTKKNAIKFTHKLAQVLDKPGNGKFERRVNVNGIDEIWAAEFTDAQAVSKKDHKGIKYSLIVIDVFSELVWIVSLEQKKTGQDVANAFSKNL